MKVDGNVVVSFNDLHIPFDDQDAFWFVVKEGKIDRLKSGFGRGRDTGMQGMFDAIPAEELVDQMVASENEDDAAFDMSTLIMADEGTTISGDDIAAMMEERKRTGASFAKLAQNIKNARVQTIIGPGKGVPEIAPRKPNRGKSKK